MRKILLGISVLFSLAFLAACGSGSNGSAGSDGTSGTSGSTGATGDTGATGGTGSIDLFQDVNLNISYNGASGAVPGSTPTAVPLDTGAVVGALSGALIVSGTDNLTDDNRAAYYLYTETSAGVKRKLTGETHSQVSVRDTDLTDGHFDTRVKTADNITVAVTDYTLLEGVAGTTYSTAYVSVCPGNEAGDGVCASVLAPAYDRGLETTAATLLTAGAVAKNASITHTGTSFNVVMDNATGATTVTGGSGAVSVNLTPTKALFATAITTGDNVSVAFRPSSINGGLLDNASMFSNSILRGSNVWYAMSADNATTGAEGDNVTLISRPADCTTQALCVGADNGTFISNVPDLTTPPQITDAGDGTYVVLGAGAAITAFNVRDNTTVSSLGGITQGAALNNWCSTSSGTSGAGALVVSDNGTNGWIVNHVLDNGTTIELADDTGPTDDQVATSFCAVTYNAGTYYLAVTDIVATATLADNVSVWKSTDGASWTQIGDDFAPAGSIPYVIDNIAIGTTGATAADSGVWVAIDNSTSTGLLHYEDIAGGSSPAWREVATVVTGDAGSLSMATDGTSVIGVTITDGTSTKTGFWYNQ
jgi:hypothetical protein